MKLFMFQEQNVNSSSVKLKTALRSKPNMCNARIMLRKTRNTEVKRKMVVHVVLHFFPVDREEKDINHKQLH